MTVPTYEWILAALTYSDRLAKDELLRTANENTYRASVLHQLLSGGTYNDVLNSTRASEEWKEKHAPHPPDPEPEVPGANGTFRVFGQRAAGDDDGAKLYVGLSRFTWLRDWKFDRDRVLREMDADRAAGYRYARVFAQVANMGPDTYWSGREIDADWADHDGLIGTMTDAAAERGLLLLWTIVGKGGPADDQRYRVELVQRVATVLRYHAKGVLFPECVNEPGFYLSLNALRELYDAGKQEAPNLQWATGAVWTEPGWVENKPKYEGATAFSSAGWNKTQGQIGVAHLDRDLGDGAERPDRPWRQAWDVGLEGRRWCDNEHIGPGASVNSESRANVLRSHRAVAFLCRAFATCLQGEAGVRGLSPWEAEPAYLAAPRAVRFLPGDLVNGQQHNANEKFPNRPFDISTEFIRSESGKGIIRLYTCQAPDGAYYTIPFAPVSRYEFAARFGMKVRCFQQDFNDLIWEREVQPGEVIDFSPEPAIDYVLESRLL